MSSIIWVLTIVASGMYGMPVPIRVTFPTEIACEQARSSVEVSRSLITSECKPEKSKVKVQ